MMNGGNLFDLQKILGHTDVKMTQRYAHLSQAHMESKTKGLIFGAENELLENPTPILPPSGESAFFGVGKFEVVNG